jgi:DNA invertase Pin-like site-specific DNA recombinase
MTPKTATTPRRAVAYVRVSTEEQVQSGYGLEDQERKTTAAIAAKGWQLVEVVHDDGASAKSLDRPGVQRALGLIATGEADAVVVATLDRLTRRLSDAADLIDWLTEAGAALVALDISVDTSTSTGRLMVHMLATVAEWEREQISTRTRAAAAVRRSQGRPGGRPGVRDQRPDLAERIRKARDVAYTWQAIADMLNREGVPTIRGGTKWRVSSVQAAAGYVRPAPRSPAKLALPELPRRSR